MDGRQILVFSGMVQGVGFRWRARRLAFRHGLTGWVANDPDGTVRMELEGPAVARADMLAELAESQGEWSFHFHSEDAPPLGYGEFVIRD